MGRDRTTDELVLVEVVEVREEVVAGVGEGDEVGVLFPPPPPSGDAPPSLFGGAESRDCCTLNFFGFGMIPRAVVARATSKP